MFRFHATKFLEIQLKMSAQRDLPLFLIDYVMIKPDIWAIPESKESNQIFVREGREDIQRKERRRRRKRRKVERRRGMKEKRGSGIIFSSDNNCK